MANEYDKRMDVFLEELTELCRKHDKMIGGGSMYPTIIDRGPGDKVAQWFPDHEIYLTWRKSNGKRGD